MSVGSSRGESARSGRFVACRRFADGLSLSAGPWHDLFAFPGTAKAKEFGRYEANKLYQLTPEEVATVESG